MTDVCKEIERNIKVGNDVFILIPHFTDVSEIERCIYSLKVHMVDLNDIKRPFFLFGRLPIVFIKDISKLDSANPILEAKKKNIRIICIVYEGLQYKRIHSLLREMNLSIEDIFSKFIRIRSSEDKLLTSKVQSDFSKLDSKEKQTLRYIYILNAVNVYPTIEILESILNRELDEEISTLKLLEFVEVKDNRIFGRMEYLEYIFGEISPDRKFYENVIIHLPPYDRISLIKYMLDNDVHLDLCESIIMDLLKTLSPVREPKLYADTLYILGKLRLKISYKVPINPSKIFAPAKEAADIYLRIKDKEGYIDSLNLMGVAFLNLARDQDTINYLKKALDVFHRLVDETEGINKGIALSNLGTAYFRLAEVLEDIIYALEGERNLSEALKIFQDYGLKVRIRNTLVNMGAIYDFMGSNLKNADFIKKAIANYKKALSMTKEDERTIKNIIRNNLALCLSTLGKLEGNEDHFKEAIEFLNEALSDAEGTEQTIMLYHNLSSIYSSWYDVSRNTEHLLKAKEFMEKILSIPESRKFKAKYCHILVELAEIYEKLGMFDKENKVLEEALELAKSYNIQNLIDKINSMMEKIKDINN